MERQVRASSGGGCCRSLHVQTSSTFKQLLVDLLEVFAAAILNLLDLLVVVSPCHQGIKEIILVLRGNFLHGLDTDIPRVADAKMLEIR